MAKLQNGQSLVEDVLTIRVKNLTSYRNDYPVFSGVSFHLKPSDHLFIRGSNGSGKTTLLKTLLSLSSKFEGTLQIPLHETAYLGHLNGLKPELSVWENHKFWLELNNKPFSDRLLVHFKVDGLADTPIRLLSEGQKRKIALAGALGTDKRIWLLDEPFNALDTEGQILLSELVQAHCENSGIVVLTSHLEPITQPTQSISLDDYQ